MFPNTWVPRELGGCVTGRGVKEKVSTEVGGSAPKIEYGESLVNCKKKRPVVGKTSYNS